MSDQPGAIIPPAASNGRSRQLFRVVAAALALAMVAIIYFLLDGRSSATERQAKGILQEVRRQERANTSRLAGWLNSLPDPFSKLGEWYSSRNQKGSYEFAEELAGLGTNTIPLLTNSLATDPSVAVREVSVMALGNLSAHAAVPALTNALTSDGAQNVREAAASALEKIGDAAALPALKKALLAEAISSVRAFVVTTLATVGGRDVVPDLRAAGRREKTWDVRASLARALADFQDAQAVPVFAAWLRESQVTNTGPASRYSMGVNSYDVREVIKALGQLGGDSVYQILAELWQNEPSPEIRASICEVFGLLGDLRALPRLREALTNTNEEEVRAAAAESLGQLGDTNSVAALAALLDDPKLDVRKNAASALGRLRGHAAVPTLLKVLERNSNDELRAGVCRALGQIGDTTALDAMLKVLPKMIKEREQVIWAVGHLGNSNAISALASALKWKEREERFAAAYALVEIGGDAAANTVAASLADQDEFARHGKACALAMLGRTNGMTAVRAGLRAKEPWRRFGSTLAFARLQIPADSSEWQPVLADPDPALRRLGNEAAGGRVVPALVEMLQDRKRDYRQYAARGLLFFCDSAALSALREARRDRDAVVRDAAELAVNFIERAESERK